MTKLLKAPATGAISLQYWNEEYEKERLYKDEGIKMKKWFHTEYQYNTYSANSTPTVVRYILKLNIDNHQLKIVNSMIYKPSDGVCDEAIQIVYLDNETLAQTDDLNLAIYKGVYALWDKICLKHEESTGECRAPMFCLSVWLETALSIQAIAKI